MKKALTKREKPFLTPKQKELLKSTVNRSLSDDEFKIFMMVCERKRLDPFQKQIYAVKRRMRQGEEPVMTIQTGIDGLRALAARTGRYAGNDDAVFEEGKPFPLKATVTVWGMVAGARAPFTATAWWGEYYPGEKLGFMWRKMPHVMLAKVAEALALRKFAPEDLSGLYIPEEMDQAGKVVTVDWKDREQVSEAEAEELDDGFRRHMEPEEALVENVGNTVILAKLVGPESKFGKDIQAARSWVKELTGQNLANLDEKARDIVLATLQDEENQLALPGQEKQKKSA